MVLPPHWRLFIPFPSASFQQNAQARLGKQTCLLFQRKSGLWIKLFTLSTSQTTELGTSLFTWSQRENNRKGSWWGHRCLLTHTKNMLLAPSRMSHITPKRRDTSLCSFKTNVWSLKDEPSRVPAQWQYCEMMECLCYLQRWSLVTILVTLELLLEWVAVGVGYNIMQMLYICKSVYIC